MATTWAMAKLTFRLLFRRGGAWLLLGACAGVSGLTFAFCRSDGQLVNEFTLRSRYALTLGVTLLSLTTLYLACASLRGDLDAKRLHLLTSYPLPRLHIFAGKWLGLFAVALLGLGVCLGTVVLCGAWLVHRHPAESERTEWRERVLGVRREVSQDLDNLEQRVNAEVELQLKQARDMGTLPPDRPLADLRREWHDLIWRRWQLVRPGETISWRFRLPAPPREATELTVVFRYYCSDKVRPLAGRWGVGSPGHQHMVVRHTSVHPFTNGEFSVPIDVVPPDGRVWVVFERDHPRELREPIFHHGTSVRLFYRESSLAGNLARAAVLLAAHLGVLIAVGLLLATAFTMTVAAFNATVLYLVAAAAPFFEQFLRELAEETHFGLMEMMGNVVVRVGLFFATGLEPPAVIAPLSQGILIDAYHLGMSSTRMVGGGLCQVSALWNEHAPAAARAAGVDLTLGWVVYAALAAGLGIWLLRRKELDRVH